MWRMALPPRAAAAAGVEAINSTVFHSRRRQGQGRGGAHAPGGKSAFIFHHGHTDCDCSAITPTGAPPLELRRCRPGCLPPATQIKNNGTWWDLYNVSSFLHAEGHDVFIVSMPLKGVNAGPGANATADNKDHWWFLRIEQAREPALRYFVEPAVATVNYALALGYERVHMAGLSGGGWTTTVVSALDPRIRTSFPIAGSVPCAMRDPEVGPDREDFEQSCAPDPSVEAPQHPGRALYRACNYTCMYLLAGLEAERYQLQILHENDDCCYATHGRHDQMLAYEGHLRAELGARQEHGYFTCAATNHTHHEVCAEDKEVWASAMRASPGLAPGDPRWESLPCDILHNARGACPVAGDTHAKGALGLSTGTTRAKTLGLIVPLYERNFTGDWERVRRAAAKVPVIAVGNAHSSDTYDADFATAVARLRAAGVTFLHYVHTRNTSAPTAGGLVCCDPTDHITGLIDKVANYSVDGIFFDNIFAPPQPGADANLEHYQIFAAHARAALPTGAVVMTNGPGKHAELAGRVEEFVALGDKMLFFESYETNWRTKWPSFNASFLYQYPSSRFGAIAHAQNASAENMRGDIDLARERNIGWFYHADTPYQHLPQWFEEMVDYIASGNAGAASGAPAAQPAALRVTKAQIEAFGEAWIELAPPGVTVGGEFCSESSGCLIENGTRSQLPGEDALGNYVETERSYATSADGVSGGSTLMTTAVRSYEDGRHIVLKQYFPSGVSNFGASTSDFAPPGSAFPAMTLGVGRLNASEAPLSWLSFGFQTVPMGGGGAPFPEGYKSGILEGGLPLVLVDPLRPEHAIVLGPLGPTGNELMSATCGVAAGGGQFHCGFQGAATSLPPGQALETLLVASESGVRDAILAYGAALRAMHGKPTPNESPIAAADPQATKLGYSTVGHYFYGLRTGQDARSTLAAVRQGLEERNVSVGWWLIDSWWYGEMARIDPASGGANSTDGYGGVWRWDDQVARAPFAFGARGWEGLREALGGAPVVAHIGMWNGNASSAGAPPYAADARFDWEVDAAASLPLGEAFWEWLFPQARKWGLTAIKLDHTQTQIPGTASLMRDVDAAGEWLSSFSRVMERHGLLKMVGGHTINAFLHSVTLPSAIVARVGDDYIPKLKRGPGSCGAAAGAATNEPLWGNSSSNARIALNSVLPWSLGLLPYKDSVLSQTQQWEDTTCYQPKGHSYVLPEWHGAQERYPSLHLTVAALSAGPVSVCDGVGMTNTALVARAARADGMLLKPARPAFALEERFQALALGDAPGGEISQTYSEVSGGGDATGGVLRFHYLLGFALEQPRTVRPSVEMGLDIGRAHAAWRWSGGSGKDAPSAADIIVLGGNGGADTLALAAAPNATAWGCDFSLWRMAPVLGDGSSAAIAVLGDVHAIVSGAPQRLADVGTSASSLRASAPAARVTTMGAPGERVRIGAALLESPPPAGVRRRALDVAVVDCIIGAQARALATFDVSADGSSLVASCGPEQGVGDDVSRGVGHLRRAGGAFGGSRRSSALAAPVR